MDFKTIKEEILFLDSLSNPTERDKQLSAEMQKLLQLRKADVMAMLCPVTYLEKVNRVEVIDQKGRSYVNWKPTNKTELSLQDDGKTLKVFISN